MKNPAVIIPDAIKAIQAGTQTIFKSGAPAFTLALAQLRQPDQRVRFRWDSGGRMPNIVVDVAAAGSAAGCGSLERGRP